MPAQSLDTLYNPDEGSDADRLKREAVPGARV